MNARTATNTRYYLSHKKQMTAYTTKWRKANLEKSRNYCRKYDQTEGGKLSRKKRNKWRMTLRNNLLTYYKSKACADCQQFYNPWQMDFDHRPGTDKKFCVGANRLDGLKKLIEEIRKCDVVCSNCHRERTHKRFYAINRA